MTDEYPRPPTDAEREEMIAMAKAERARRDAYNAEHGVKMLEDCTDEERAAFGQALIDSLEKQIQEGGDRWNAIRRTMGLDDI